VPFVKLMRSLVDTFLLIVPLPSRYGQNALAPLISNAFGRSSVEEAWRAWTAHSINKSIKYFPPILAGECG
jgi:hypothetical protein